MTTDTCGQPGSRSPASAALQSSLESRLQALTACAGSTLFTLTWKRWATPAGLSLFRLRASARRTSGTGCTSWPTARAEDAESSGARLTRGVSDTLTATAALASWPTTTANDAIRFPARGTRTPNVTLNHAASWAAPQARDGKGARTGESLYQHNARPLNEQAVMLLGSGQTPNGSGAATRSSGQLNPAHSRWLMGLPSIWDQAAPTKASLGPRCSAATATRSSRRPPRPSSAPTDFFA